MNVIFKLVRTLVMAGVIVHCALAAGMAYGSPSQFHITFDDTAVRQLLALEAAKDARDASVEAWLDLPANVYLLEVGARESNLTRAQLKDNAIAVIRGTATRESQPIDGMGSLWVASSADYLKMLDDLRATLADRIAHIAARDAAFAPSGTDISETVYLHLGGDWDAVNDRGSIYVNMRYWHDQARPSWDGINMIVAHETMHTVQNEVYGNPEGQDDGASAFLTLLSKIQREGTARYVEYDADPGPYASGTYGFFERALDTEMLRSFPKDTDLLGQLATACFPTLDHEKFGEVYQTNINGGGPYYDVGHGIAKAIDEHMGRPALIETIKRGPKVFFADYIALCGTDRRLPKLPDDVVRQVAVMKDKL